MRGVLCLAESRPLHSVPGLTIVTLGQGVQMLPLSHWDRIDSISTYRGTLISHRVVPAGLLQLCSRLCESRLFVYIEAQHIDRIGPEAHALVSRGKLLAEPVVSINAINRGLLYLGVAREAGKDESASIGLDSWARSHQAFPAAEAAHHLNLR